MESLPRLGFSRPDATDNNDVVRDLDALTNALVSIGALFYTGTLAARPAAAYNGRFYLVTSAASTGALYFDTGSLWRTVGALVPGTASFEAAASTDVPATLKGFTGQTADLLRAYLPDGTTLGTRITNNSDLGLHTIALSEAGGSGTSALSAVPRAGSSPAAVFRRSASQSVNVFEVQNSAGTVADLAVTSSGNVVASGDVTSSIGSMYDIAIYTLMGVF